MQLRPDDFWHKIKKNRAYWVEKIEENIDRDKRNDAELHGMEWIPVHFWEKDVLSNVCSTALKAA
jgi:DNA mismatch endonuclease (patch repair protein)